MAASVRQRNKVLRKLIKLTEGKERMKIHAHAESFSSIADEKTLKIIFQKLADLDLITISAFDSQQINVGLTPLGRTYFDRRAEERWQFFNRSVLIPIAVAFVTSVIAQFVLPWLKSLITAPTP